MRIGIEAQRIFRKKKHGMDIYALELIRHLQKADQENEYFIFVKSGEDAGCLTETHNFKIVEVKGFTYADWEQISLPRAAKKYNLDILHCTSNTAPIHCDIPVYLTLHDIIYLSQSFSGGSWYQQLGHYYRKWIVPLAFRKAKKVFTVSQFEKGRIEEYFGKTDKVEVIYNGVAAKFQMANARQIEEVREHVFLPEKYLFFLGNTAPKKNMTGMLQAYKMYRENAQNPLPLVVAETGFPTVMDMLKKINAENLVHHIYLTGYLNHNWLPVVYAQAEAFIYPSLRESFGIPIIESMACGTPVVTSNTSSMPEVAGGYALLADPYSPEQIADRMVKITEDRQLRNALINSGISWGHTFTWNETARRTLQAYGIVTHDHLKAAAA